MLSADYQYVGSAHWGEKQRCCFLTPIFIKDDKYYVQKLENGRVVDFIEIEEPHDDYYFKFNGSRKIRIGRQDRVFYCFNVSLNLQVQGDRGEITKHIVKLLYSNDQVNVHSKFLIANFLNLHNLQIELLKVVNSDLKSKGVEGIDSEEVFDEIYKGEEAFNLKWVLEKFKSLKQICQQVADHDLIFIDGKSVFFDNTRFSLATVCNKISTENKEFDSLLASSLRKSKELLGSTSDILIESNLDAAEYMACSSYYFKNDNILAKSLINMDVAGTVTGSEIVTLGSMIENRFVAGFKPEGFSNISNQKVDEIKTQFFKVTGGSKLK